MAIPPKLVKRVHDLEFRDMNELLWSHDLTVVLPGLPHSLRRTPASDTLVWVQLFSTMVAVLATKYPEWVPDFMAY